MKQVLQQYAVQWLLNGGLAIAVSYAVRALEPPQPMGNRFYRWFYRWTQLMLANPDKAKQAK